MRDICGETEMCNCPAIAFILGSTRAWVNATVRICGGASAVTNQSSGGTSHDYVPIIVMTVIVVAIVLVLLILAQYTKVLDRKKPANGFDDPESAQNAGKIEKLNQKAPTQSYKSWKEKSEEATGSVKQSTTHVVW
ncbi:hypothetical protein THAR02_10692 [Trichoderma harzianum]|uniref:Uncharacterized protein n=1 Tax=Trichoderma harzianum TaxID=5544 RepID=A0A0F9ZVP5_TRIHA|nr:hypothetical protein THAR02_10692 [Trichoderma harzianum]